MGYTTFFSSELTFKPGCPAQLLCNTIDEHDSLDPRAVKYVEKMFPSVPVAFWETAHEVLATHNGDYEFRQFDLVKKGDGSHVLSSRSATKRRNVVDLERVIEALKPQLVLTPGRIIARCVGEDAVREAVICVRQQAEQVLALLTEDGYLYDNDQGYLTDFNHPKDALSIEQPWMPPWDYQELQTLNAQRKAEKQASWHPQD